MFFVTALWGASAGFIGMICGGCNTIVAVVSLNFAGNHFYLQWEHKNVQPKSFCDPRILMYQLFIYTKNLVRHLRKIQRLGCATNSRKHSVSQAETALFSQEKLSPEKCENKFGPAYIFFFRTKSNWSHQNRSYKDFHFIFWSVGVVGLEQGCERTRQCLPFCLRNRAFSQTCSTPKSLNFSQIPNKMFFMLVYQTAWVTKRSGLSMFALQS